MTRQHALQVFWSGAEAGTSALLSFASAFIVARLTGPSEIGIGAAVIAVHVLLWVTVNALFADALVQRSELDNDTFSSACVASTIVGCGAALLQLAAAAPLVWSLADSRLLAMSLVLALPLPLVGAAGPVQGLLTRERAYRQLALRTLIGQGLGCTAGVGIALLGLGAWALVLQQLVISGGGALVLLIQNPRRPDLMLDRRSLHQMLRVGLPLTASTLVHHGRYRLFALLIGSTAGAAVLGQVHMAFRLVDSMRDLAFTAQWRLMLPLLSESQDSLPHLRARVDDCLDWSSLPAFPLCAAMAVGVQPVVALLLGSLWQPASETALPLIVLAAWLFLTFPAGVAVVARGEARLTLVANVAGTLATVLGVLLVHPATPLAAVLVWLGAQAFVTPYVLWSNGWVLGTHPLHPLRRGLPMLAAMLLATIVAFTVFDAAAPGWQLTQRLLVVAAFAVPAAGWQARRPLARTRLAAAQAGRYGSAPGAAIPESPPGEITEGVARASARWQTTRLQIPHLRHACRPMIMIAIAVVRSVRATRLQNSTARSPARRAATRHRGR